MVCGVWVCGYVGVRVCGCGWFVCVYLASSLREIWCVLCGVWCVVCGVWCVVGQSRTARSCSCHGYPQGPPARVVRSCSRFAWRRTRALSPLPIIDYPCQHTLLSQFLPAHVQRQGQGTVCCVVVSNHSCWVPSVCVGEQDASRASCFPVDSDRRKHAPVYPLPAARGARRSSRQGKRKSGRVDGILTAKSGTSTRRRSESTRLLYSRPAHDRPGPLLTCADGAAVASLPPPSCA